MRPEGIRWRVAVIQTLLASGVVAASALGSLLLLSGCRLAPADTEPAHSISALSAAHAAWRRRAATEFDQAHYFKPGESSVEDEILSLSPLIVQQVDDPAGAVAPRFGIITLDPASSRVAVEPAIPTVYADRGAITIRGIEYPQVSFFWCYGATPCRAEHAPQSASDDAGRRRAGIEKAAHCLGVRITMGRDGFPVVWEVFDDNADSQRLFVARALEEAAHAFFGAPLPGRAHAVERDLGESPQVIVVRVLDDGPVPMGPYVYLDATARTITTILCRCSPSQCSHFVEEHRYRLVPWESLNERLRRTWPEPLDLTAMLRWPTGW